MQQHGSKYFVCRPPPPLGMGSICQNLTFFEHGYVVYQINITRCSSMVANILPASQPLTLTLGLLSKAQNSFVSEHGHVAYQIKEYRKCSNMVANNLSVDPPPPPTHTHTQPRDGVKRSNSNFFRTWSC